MTESTRPSSSFTAPGILLGLGLGGFIDGIVLHQILQWHHLVSHVEDPATVRGLEINTLADGAFHAASWVLVFAGIVIGIAQWRSSRRAPSWSRFAGLVIAGWGIFNVVEGLINHFVLQVHHVRDDLGGPVGWDVAFLILGVVLTVGGGLLARRSSTRPEH